MSSAKTIAKNMGFLFLTQVLDKILSFFLIVLITRYLGDVGLGKYSFAFAFIGIFIAISNLGINVYVFREIAKDKLKAKKLVDNFLSLRVFMVIVLYVIITIISWKIPKTREIMSLLLLVMIHELFGTLNNIITIVYQAYEKNEFSVYSIIVEKSLALSFGAYVLITGYGLNTLLLALVIAKAISFIFYYTICYKKFVKISLGMDFRLWKMLIKDSIPFGLTKAFGIVNHEVDKVLLTMMKSYAITGLYSAAAKLVDAITLIPTIIVLATFPVMSRFYHTNLQDFSKLLYKKSMYYTISIALPITVGVSLLAQRLILFIYKGSVTDSWVVLQIMSWSLIFIFINYIMGYLLNSINKQHLFTISTGVCLLANVILNFLLIPRFGYTGTAIVAVTTQFLNFCLLYYFTIKNGYPLNLIKISYKPIIAGSLMGILILYLKMLPIICIIPIGAIIYFILLFLIRGIEKEEIELIKSFIPKKS